MPVSFRHSQLCCLWSKRLGLIILSLVLIFGLLYVHKFYIYRVIRKQVHILEADLVDFDQAVRDKHNLISEKKRLEQKLDYFHMQKSTQCHDLATYLLDIANLIIQHSGSTARIKFSNRIRQGEILDTIADITKIKNELGWLPKVSLARGLESCILISA